MNTSVTHTHTQIGIDEDPVTGSAHCALAPYFASQLGRSTVHGYQASSRGGVITCLVDQDAQRCRLQGFAVTISEGTLRAP
jgi:predicted PhzF superfamily epimerase YddE/YHI9